SDDRCSGRTRWPKRQSPRSTLPHQPAPVEHNAGSTAPDRARCTLGVPTPPAPHGPGPHSAGGARGLVVSLGGLFQDQLVQRQISHCPLQPGVLPLKLLQPLRLIQLQTAILGAPPIIGLLRHADRPAQLCNLAAAGQPNLHLTKLPNNLFRRVTLPGHLPPPRKRPNLSSGLDRV